MHFLLLKYLFMYFSQSGHDLIFISCLEVIHRMRNARNFFYIPLL
ncbi:hypothetical protein BAXH7_02579 [Bacillus amyloliquefaciens XH7]|nr:hypothetical protein LL3_02656 [Bacillus amyloliquefaciens LL3]AEK89707.1 hypothetical protein BAXH7_02579 [Bacillus amyloliquefaciens XH7]